MIFTFPFKGQLQQEMLLSSEKERSAADIAQEMKSKVKTLDVQVKSLKSEKKKLESSLEEETTKNREMEEFVQKYVKRSLYLRI